jgi:histidinol phosphatase-like PHP family hydrolase
VIPRIDLHVHSQFSPCAENVSVRGDAALAVEKGIEVMAITDHGTEPQPRWLDRYFAELERVRREFEGRLTLLAGMEVDVVEGRLVVESGVLRRLDVVVASVHEIPQGVDAAGYWRRCALGAVRSGSARVLGHPTWVYGYRVELVEGEAGAPEGRVVRLPVEHVLEVLDEAREAGVAVELNYHHRDPNPLFVKLAVERGVELVPDSDAHNLSEIGNWSWYEQALRAAGVRPEAVRWLDPGKLG